MAGQEPSSYVEMPETMNSPITPHRPFTQCGPAEPRQGLADAPGNPSGPPPKSAGGYDEASQKSSGPPDWLTSLEKESNSSVEKAGVPGATANQGIGSSSGEKERAGLVGVPLGTEVLPRTGPSSVGTQQHPASTAAQGPEQSQQALTVAHKEDSSRRCSTSLGSRGKSSTGSSRECIPSIDLKKKTKFDYLSEGSTARGDKERVATSSAGSALRQSSTPPQKKSPRGQLVSASVSPSDAELVSHVESNSYGFELRSSFLRLNFRSLLVTFRSNRGDTPEMQRCRSLFHVLTKGKQRLSMVDLHELLLIFTPRGVSMREAGDFMWEECNQCTSLSFKDFLFFGESLRNRLFDYEMFEHLDDRHKLRTIHARIFPGIPPSDLNKIRLNLVKAAEEQAAGTAGKSVRPFRRYEELFLVDYQEKLVDSGLIDDSEIPDGGAGEYSHEHRCHPASVPLSEENVSWNADDNTNAAAATAANPYNAASSPRGRQTSKPGAGDRLWTGHTSSNRAIVRYSSPPRTASSAKGSSQGRLQLPTKSPSFLKHSERPPFNLELQQHPRRSSSRKYMGRTAVVDYMERRALDDNLIGQLQEMYR